MNKYIVFFFLITTLLLVLFMCFIKGVIACFLHDCLLEYHMRIQDCINSNAKLAMNCYFSNLFNINYILTFFFDASNTYSNYL